ncbi:MAG: hypothetical protein ACI4TK_00790 [Agathobacter sp.]
MQSQAGDILLKADAPRVADGTDGGVNLTYRKESMQRQNTAP